MIRLLAMELIFMFAFMSLWFAIAIWRKRNDIADIVWGLGFIAATLVALFLSWPVSTRALLVSALVLIWGGRLAIRIFLRNRGKEEDRRYQEWRKQWGDHFLIGSFLQVFMLQGILILIVASPVLLVINSAATPLNLLDYIGVLIWLIGFGFEHQLDCFTKNPANKGKVMKYGLWRYSRHPNYFGEVLLWWGVFLLALSVDKGLLSVIGPLTITFLILKVSGIPLAEKRLKNKEEFQDYMQKTSVFIPLPPKKEKSS